MKRSLPIDILKIHIKVLIRHEILKCCEGSLLASMMQRSHVPIITLININPLISEKHNWISLVANSCQMKHGHSILCLTEYICSMINQKINYFRVPNKTCIMEGRHWFIFYVWFIYKSLKFIFWLWFRIIML